MHVIYVMVNIHVYYVIQSNLHTMQYMWENTHINPLIPFYLLFFVAIKKDLLMVIYKQGISHFLYMY